jgi:alkanesulfonate monooxygenase SsuD/methylene tetrahydromethanopterin reductase-like flavin-dependent oxidoreductase (luciferase family)
MRLGLFLSAQGLAGADPRAVAAEQVALVRAARDAGFATVLAPQHFLSGEVPMLQPVPLLGRLAAEAGDMRIGTGVLLLPLLNPVEVAETAATLCALAPAGVAIGVGLGYRAVEDAAFGVAPERVRSFTARLAAVRGLLEGREVTADGPGFRLEGARLAIAPATPPAIWVAANRDAAVRRAARLGDSWLVNPHATLATLERQVAIFRAERGGAPLELPVVREACVAPTDAAALAAAGPHLTAKYATYLDWGQDDAMPAGDDLRSGFHELREDRFVIGAPATAAARLRELRDRTGATEAILRVSWPGLPLEDALRSVRLLGEEVAPLL